MRNTEMTKNLPHIIAVGVLLLALLIVATKTGLVGCSSLGTSYCDMYYSVLGKPTVLIVRGDEGMGSPDTLARMIENQYQLPVQKLGVEQISRGNIQDYTIIIVEQARMIPTEKLKVFNDYLFEDMGRLVWVGDAGTVGASSDETCRLMEYTAEWKADDGKHREEYEENICLKESDVFASADATASEVVSMKRDIMVEKAFGHLEALCEDAFEGSLGVYGTKGYPCDGAGYEDVYFNWMNEESFRSSVNPWTRGEYEKLTTEGKESGINFGKNVLGVGFVADDFAVAEFDLYYDGINEVKEGLIKAHTGFVACSNSLTGELCNLGAKENLVKSALANLDNQKDNAQGELSGIVTTLNSLAQQKEAKNESSSLINAASNRLENDIDEIEAVNVPLDTITNPEITAIEAITTTLDGSREELVQLRGDESDATVKSNYDQHIAAIEARITSFESKIDELRGYIADYNECAGAEIQTMTDLIEAETGYREELDTLIAYSSPMIDENGAVDFIRQAQGSKWDGLAGKLKTISLECGGDEFTTGMAEAANAIEVAQETLTDPATESEALATMQVADVKHPLVEGVTRTKDLKKNDLPVPFVLVETNDVDSHEVIQLRVTPAYEGINTWPGITVKDPKFASHIFGRGVVVYYAFPPETDEVFVKNLVEFLLY